MVWTPLHYAICQGHTGIAHRLLNAGARPECIIDRNFPRSRFPGLEEVEKVYNAAPLPTNPHPDAEGSHLTWIKQRHRSFRALGDANTELTTIAALHTAALHGNKTVSRRLVKMSVKINSSSGSCGSRPGRFHGAKSPLSYAILSANRSMTRLFLSMGADPIDHGLASIHSRSLAVAVAFDLRRPEAAMTLLRSGSPTWGAADPWHTADNEHCVLSYVLSRWRERSEPKSTEDILLKRRAFLMLTRETVKSPPWGVWGGDLRAVLVRAFLDMCADEDFDLKALMEYLKITGLTLETPVKYLKSMSFRLETPAEGAPNLATAALYMVVFYLAVLPPCSQRQSTINYLLQNGASTTIAWGKRRDPLDEFLRDIVGRASGEDRGEFTKKVAENVTGIIDFVNFLASHGALDRVQQKDRNSVLQAYGNLVGLSGEHALDLPTRRRLRAGTVTSIPRRLLKSLRGFETCLY
ncbi:trf1-interacting ankyrin-related adp-ribose polymerase 2 [Colletotrichum plurivorum]|uniref:Trf1-interacting ankyrin-related adp-ribose polymerase 2 n=1 Tax=Colletotrichum plurivorum TaxID=2175906 RepID=A0A8H6MZC8_9PEZI|nr:trf1-interacting ankyrin-related adp-ribose polymerase 2 [Colletotrichum plurivorum]